MAYRRKLTPEEEAKAPKCKNPECKKKCYKKSSGLWSDFCEKECAQKCKNMYFSR